MCARLSAAKEGFFQLRIAYRQSKDADIPIELCQTSLDIYEDQNVWDNDYLVKIAYPESKRTISMVPIQFDSEDILVFTPTGMLGSATIEVMKEFGYTDEKINQSLVDRTVKGATSLEELA